MTKLAVHLHAVGGPDFSSSDRALIAAARVAFGSASDQLVMARDFAKVLRQHGLNGWAANLEHEEQAHMVRLVLTS